MSAADALPPQVDIDVETALRYLRDRIAVLKRLNDTETCAYSRATYNAVARDFQERLDLHYHSLMWVLPVLVVLVALVLVVVLLRRSGQLLLVHWRLWCQYAAVGSVPWLDRIRQRHHLGDEVYRQARARLIFWSTACVVLALPMLTLMLYSNAVMDAVVGQWLSAMLPQRVVRWWAAEGRSSAPSPLRQWSSRLLNLYFWYYVGPALLYGLLYLLQCATDNMKEVVLGRLQSSSSFILEALHTEAQKRERAGAQEAQEERHVELTTLLMAERQPQHMEAGSPAPSPALLPHYGSSGGGGGALEEDAGSPPPEPLYFSGEDEEEGDGAARTPAPVSPG